MIVFEHGREQDPFTRAEQRAESRAIFEGAMPFAVARYYEPPNESLEPEDVPQEVRRALDEMAIGARRALDEMASATYRAREEWDSLRDLLQQALDEISELEVADTVGASIEAESRDAREATERATGDQSRDAEQGDAGGVRMGDQAGV